MRLRPLRATRDAAHIRIIMRNTPGTERRGAPPPSPSGPPAAGAVRHAEPLLDGTPSGIEVWATAPGWVPIPGATVVSSAPPRERILAEASVVIRRVWPAGAAGEASVVGQVPTDRLRAPQPGRPFLAALDREGAIEVALPPLTQPSGTLEVATDGASLTVRFDARRPAPPRYRLCLGDACAYAQVRILLTGWEPPTP